MGTWWESGTECKNNIKDIHNNTAKVKSRTTVTILVSHVARQVCIDSPIHYCVVKVEPKTEALTAVTPTAIQIEF